MSFLRYGSVCLKEDVTEISLFIDDKNTKCLSEFFYVMDA